MRLAPPIPALLQREALYGGVTIHHKHFPAGTDLAVTAMALGQNEAYYEDPAEFKPERWLSPVANKDGKDEDLKRAQSAFFVFAAGSRGCVGRNLAYIEMMTLFARLVYRCDVRRAHGDRRGDDGTGRFDIQDVFLAEKDGPMLEFRLREDT